MFMGQNPGLKQTFKRRSGVVVDTLATPHCVLGPADGFFGGGKIIHLQADRLPEHSQCLTFGLRVIAVNEELRRRELPELCSGYDTDFPK